MATSIRFWPRQLLMALVRLYRLLLSPWLGNSCRFEPTCSVYSLQALESHGAAVGAYLTVARLARCHPWCEPGFDPVPERAPALFTHLMGGASGRRAPSPSPLPDKNFP